MEVLRIVECCRCRDGEKVYGEPQRLEKEIDKLKNTLSDMKERYAQELEFIRQGKELIEEENSQLRSRIFELEQ